ncbi:RHS repeat-associated core domain-containing protein [Pseudomonas syringae]|uniref:RHS repeat-associated core domain-containing protein n=1 Tax=Pseudomonas syringae TaxID=317 RepID=UPI000A1E3ACC|nr:RHS repeat-associated core domain-containing protein [Pseudomonas syringae]OSN59217.1 hypothetical protein BV349_05407 [Pseudomonas syringae pv. actinidiae]OSN68398.1 hypothetical protein BV351_05370 [Pseudomonas syringae pv. actinidiae]RMS02927.1 hypothetical protein ALP75_200472 [Pseudomonas syringae pv. actinidiae]
MTSSNQAVLCRYSYDPLDRLASSSPTGQADIQRFYQKNRLATEIQGALRRTVFQHEDLLLAQQRHVDGVLETTLLATDQQRSVLQLVDKAGTEPIAYSPYGHHPAESGLTSLLGFNGERRDPVTGHYLLGNGYRAYNPVLMRFNSPDSLSPFDEGGLNAYGYVGGDPVGFGDETGHVKFNIITRLAENSAKRARPSVIVPTPRMDGPQKLVASVPLNIEFSYTYLLPQGPHVQPLLAKQRSVGWSGGEVTVASTSGARRAVLDSPSAKPLSKEEMTHHRYVLATKKHIFDNNGVPLSMQSIKYGCKRRLESARAVQSHYKVSAGYNNNMILKYAKMADNYQLEYDSISGSLSDVRGTASGY